jgi:hypothetical protein
MQAVKAVRAARSAKTTSSDGLVYCIHQTRQLQVHFPLFKLEYVFVRSYGYSYQAY